MPSQSLRLRLIGLSDPEVQHILELLPLAAQQQGRIWVHCEDHDADLILTDPDTTEGLIAEARAQMAGSCALPLGEVEGSPVPLRRPLSAADLAKALHYAEGHSRKSSELFAAIADLPGFSLGEEIGSLVQERDTGGIEMEDFFAADLIDQVPAQGAPLEPVPPVHDAAELALLAEPTEHPLLPEFLPEPAISSPAPEPSDPPADRADDAPASELESPPPRPTASYRLRDYLTGRLIGIPSRIQSPGRPALVIDPLQKQFYFQGTLAEVEPYLEGLIARTQWSAMLPSMMGPIRAAIAGRSYALLHWHIALRDSQGRLPDHLEPGGRYRLRETLELPPEHERPARIAKALSGDWRGVAEVASQCRTSVNEVYAVIAAFDAIGLVEFQPRQR